MPNIDRLINHEDGLNIVNQLSLIAGSLTGSYSSLADPETSPTTNSHSQGDLIFYNHTLYEVSISIPSGTTLSVGVNITAVTVEQLLAEKQDTLTLPLSLTEGGTGSTSASGARTNLGLGDYATKSGAAVTITANGNTAPSDTTVLWVYPAS